MLPECCPSCGSSNVHLVESRLNASRQRRKRFRCAVCFERWACVDGVYQSTYNAAVEFDWRVPADEGCRNCIHCSRGFCSLGLPEARLPGFVTECEARQVEEAACVVQ
jgi:hypothetical protein